MTGYIVCLWIGALVGFGIAGVLCASGNASREEENRELRRQLRQEKMKHSHLGDFDL